MASLFTMSVPPSSLSARFLSQSLSDRTSNARFWAQCFQYKQNAGIPWGPRIQRVGSWRVRADSKKGVSKKVDVKMTMKKVVKAFQSSDSESSTQSKESEESDAPEPKVLVLDGTGEDKLLRQRTKSSKVFFVRPEEELSSSVKVPSLEWKEPIEFENGDGNTPYQASGRRALATRESEVVKAGGSKTQSSRNSKARGSMSNVVEAPRGNGSAEKSPSKSSARDIFSETTGLGFDKQKEDIRNVAAGNPATSEDDRSTRTLLPKSRRKQLSADNGGESQLVLSSMPMLRNQATLSHEVAYKDATTPGSEGRSSLLKGLGLHSSHSEADNGNFHVTFREGLEGNFSGTSSLNPSVNSHGDLENAHVSQPKRRGRRKIKVSNRTWAEGEERTDENGRSENLKAAEEASHESEVKTMVNHLGVVQGPETPVQQRISSAKEGTSTGTEENCSEGRKGAVEVHESDREQNGVQMALKLDKEDQMALGMKAAKKIRRQAHKNTVASRSNERVKKISDMDEGWIISPVEAGDLDSVIDVLALHQDWTQGATAVQDMIPIVKDRTHKMSTGKRGRGIGIKTAVHAENILLKSGRLRHKSHVKNNEPSLDTKGMGKAEETADAQIECYGPRTPDGFGNCSVNSLDLTSPKTGQDVQTISKSEDRNGHPGTSFKLPSLSWGSWWEEIGSTYSGKVNFTTVPSGALLCEDSNIEGEEYQAMNASEDMRDRETRAIKHTEKILSLGEEPCLLESLDSSQLEAVAQGSTQTSTSCLYEVEMGTEAVLDFDLEQKLATSGAAVMEPKKEADMEVEILINSPECTMQRMAILENRKLVEFLVEPLNTKVQVGNVYLGRVKQLLPGMSGIFVDIGENSTAFLDITLNQYPYTFPPLKGLGCLALKTDENGYLMSSVVEDAEEKDFELQYDDTLDDHDEEVEETHLKEGVGLLYEADIGETQSDPEGKPMLQEVIAVMSENLGSSQSLDRETKVSSTDERWMPHNYEDVGRKSADSKLCIGEVSSDGPITANFGHKFSKWCRVEEGMNIIVQVKKEAMGRKGPRLTAFPSLAGRFWVLIPRGKSVGVSSKITGLERSRLRLIAQDLQPLDFGITVRTEAVGHQREELEKDLTRLMKSWMEVMERAAAAALVVDEREQGTVPVLLHREMGQTLTTVRDFFTDKVQRLVVDSHQSYQEVMGYLQDVAPHLTCRVELYSGKVPIFDAFSIETELEKFSNNHVKLPNGGYLVMEETEALVSVDVNGGCGMLGHSTQEREAILDINLAAAQQIATELRLRDIGGIIVVDFIDMDNANDKKLVYEEMWKAIQRDRSKVFISEISEFGLMEMTRKRVRPSVTLTINEPCSSCKGTGYVEALETTLGKIERAVCRLLADRSKQGQVMEGDKWPHILLRTDPSMFDYLRAWKWKRITQLSNALKVWLTLKVAMELSHGQFQVLEQPRFASEKHFHESKLLHKSMSTSTLGKRAWPKRRRHSSS